MLNFARGRYNPRSKRLLGWEYSIEGKPYHFYLEKHSNDSCYMSSLDSTINHSMDFKNRDEWDRYLREHYGPLEIKNIDYSVNQLEIDFEP